MSLETLSYNYASKRQRSVFGGHARIQESDVSRFIFRAATSHVPLQKHNASCARHCHIVWNSQEQNFMLPKAHSATNKLCETSSIVVSHDSQLDHLGVRMHKVFEIQG